MKIAVCAIIKNENLYLREWVEHYKKLGFDKIILYDNNPIDGEVPHQVIGDYVMSGFVDVHNVRGVKWQPETKIPYTEYVNHPGNWGPLTIQQLVYTKCTLEYQNEYRWIAYVDIDEFLIFDETEPQNIHEIFDKYQYEEKGFKQILINWRNIGDDGKINYENKPVQERFTKIIYHDKFDVISNRWIKSIRCTDFISPNDTEKNTIHIHANNVKSCMPDGTPVYDMEKACYTQTNQTYYKVMAIKHYFSKSLWEHLSKQRNLKKTEHNKINGLNSYKILNGWNDEYEKVLQEYNRYINTPEKIE